MKNRKILVISALFFISPLFSCASDNVPSSSSPSSSQKEEFVLEPATFRVGNFRLELKNTRLLEGTTFVDGAAPFLYSGGKPVNGQITYLVKKNGTAFPADEPLSVGEYTFEVNTSAMTENITGSFSVRPSQTTQGEEGKGYHTISSSQSEKYRIENFSGIGALGDGKTPSIGSPKILVIPLSFSDTSFSKGELDKIEKAYFGKKEETSWESLRSYYESSSYGKLTFEGMVTDPFQYRLSSLETEQSYLAQTLTVSQIVDEVVSSVFTRDNLDPSDYDYDGDGYLDGVEVIYKSSRSMNANTEGLWWCFTSSLFDEPDKNSPKLNRYFWSLYSQIETYYYSDAIDAHTLVHETGHMLGLNDYYNYDGTSFEGGLVDMMDHNVGDHGAYSKYLLGWVTPKVVDGTSDDFTVTLSSFTDTGDCLILRNTVDDPFNGTPYDEYLMLSYITPTGVNEQDSHGYGEFNYGYGRGAAYAKSGLLLNHIDNRVISLKGSTINDAGGLKTTKASYTDEISNEEAIETIDGERTLTSSLTYTVSNNTPSQSQSVRSDGSLSNSSSVKETTIIPASKTRAFQGRSATSQMGSQDLLFGTKEFSCGSSYFSNYAYRNLFLSGTTWNDGSQNNFNFQIVSQTGSDVTIRFIRNF